MGELVHACLIYSQWCNEKYALAIKRMVYNNMDNDEYFKITLNRGNTALLYLCNQYSTYGMRLEMDTYKIILEKSNIKHQNNKGNTALIQACRNKMFIEEYLHDVILHILSGSNVAHKNNKNKTALMYLIDIFVGKCRLYCSCLTSKKCKTCNIYYDLIRQMLSINNADYVDESIKYIMNKIGMIDINKETTNTYIINTFECSDVCYKSNTRKTYDVLYNLIMANASEIDTFSTINKMLICLSILNEKMNNQEKINYYLQHKPLLTDDDNIKILIASLINKMPVEIIMDTLNYSKHIVLKKIIPSIWQRRSSCSYNYETPLSLAILNGTNELVINKLMEDDYIKHIPTIIIEKEHSCLFCCIKNKYNIDTIIKLFIIQHELNELYKTGYNKCDHNKYNNINKQLVECINTCDDDEIMLLLDTMNKLVYNNAICYMLKMLFNKNNKVVNKYIQSRKLTETIYTSDLFRCACKSSICDKQTMLLLANNINYSNVVHRLSRYSCNEYWDKLQLFDLPISIAIFNSIIDDDVIDIIIKNTTIDYSTFTTYNFTNYYRYSQDLMRNKMHAKLYNKLLEIREEIYFLLVMNKEFHHGEFGW
jgi:hypothetical protein